MTVFGPIMWLCRLKRQIFLDRQLSPASGSPPPGANWIITLSAGEITVTKHDATARESSPLGGVGGVSVLGPGYKFIGQRQMSHLLTAKPN